MKLDYTTAENYRIRLMPHIEACSPHVKVITHIIGQEGHGLMLGLPSIEDYRMLKEQMGRIGAVDPEAERIWKATPRMAQVERFEMA